MSGNLLQLLDRVIHTLAPAHRTGPVVFADSRVEVHKDKFQLIKHEGDVVAIPFDGVQLIFAHKRDLITTDLICFDVIMRDGDVVEINEEMPGFEQFLDALDRSFEKFDQKWADKVVYPAFVPNRTLVYSAVA